MPATTLSSYKLLGIAEKALMHIVDEDNHGEACRYWKTQEIRHCDCSISIARRALNRMSEVRKDNPLTP